MICKKVIYMMLILNWVNNFVSYNEVDIGLNNDSNLICDWIKSKSNEYLMLLLFRVVPYELMIKLELVILRIILMYSCINSVALIGLTRLILNSIPIENFIKCNILRFNIYL